MNRPLMIVVALSAGVACYASALRGQDAQDAMITKPFLILKSTPNYDEALAAAREAAKDLGVALALRHLSPNATSGLTLPRKDCFDAVAGRIDWPCYYARGRFDDGAYVSIEYSSAYKEFRGGQYIVIGASGTAVTRALVKKAQRFVPDAYVKSTKVYLGCMH